MSKTSTTTGERKKTIKGPNGLRIELDKDQVFPHDPGQGTPAMVYKDGKREKASGTYWRVAGEGTLDVRRGEITLTQRQMEWVNSQETVVDEFLYGDQRKAKAEQEKPQQYEGTVSVCAHNVAFNYDVSDLRFFVKKGEWPVPIAGDDTTYYVIDRENPLEDGQNPLYFTKEDKADAEAARLNKENRFDLPDELREALDEEAERRAKECIIEGCRSGDLNYLYVFGDGQDVEIWGWWEIDND